MSKIHFYQVRANFGEFLSILLKGKNEELQKQCGPFSPWLL